MKEAKEKWISDQCDNIETGMKLNNSKATFDTLTTLTRSQQPKASVIEDKNRALLTDEASVTNRWIYNYELRPDNSFLDNATNINREPGDAPILQ